MSNRATQADAELILKLYDLRREAVMRQARSFLFSFAPQTIDEVMAIVADFSIQENAYVRQVVGYWEMAASLVLRGALNEDLATDNFAEMFFVYARLEPFLAECASGPGWKRSALKCRSLWRARRRLASGSHGSSSVLRRCAPRLPRWEPSSDIRECRGRYSGAALPPFPRR